MYKKVCSLRSRRLEVVGTRKNGRAEVVGTRKNGRARRRPLACLPRARPFSLSPTTSKRLLRRLKSVLFFAVFVAVAGLALPDFIFSILTRASPLTLAKSIYF